MKATCTIVKITLGFKGIKFKESLYNVWKDRGK